MPEDKHTNPAFLDLLGKDIESGNILKVLPANAQKLMKTRDFEGVDVDI